MSSTTVEQRSIDYIPASERHGRPRSLFAVWFSANTSITAVVTGALMIVFGNSAPWAIVAIVVGNLVGGFFTALHSAQGPQLGVPQMIQSRAQFGYVGAVLPLLLALMIYVGFYATGLVLGGQALAQLTHLPQTAAAVLFAVLSTVLAIYGYRHIHRYSRLATILTGITFTALFVRVLAQPQAGTVLSDGSFDLPAFVLGLSLAASWQLTFGPYVADYSRYLPAETSKGAVFGWTLAGGAVGGSLAMILGALVAAIGGKEFMANEVGYLAHLGGPLAVVVLIAVVAGKLTGDTMSAYGGYMAIVTIATSFAPTTRLRQWVRIASIVAVSLVALVIALAADSTFLSTFTNFLLFLLYFMIPWSAINLVDYYLVRHEDYDIASLFTPAGIYGRLNVGAFVAYIAGVVIQVPFMNSSLYVGPLAALMGGAEIAWVVGLVVAGLLYWTSARRTQASTAPPTR